MAWELWVSTTWGGCKRSRTIASALHWASRNRLWSEELCAEGLLGSAVWCHTCNCAEGQADLQWIATDPTESFEAGMAPQNCSKLSKVGWAFISFHQSVIGQSPGWSIRQDEAVRTAKGNFWWATSNQYSQQQGDCVSPVGKGSGRSTMVSTRASDRPEFETCFCQWQLRDLCGN